MNKKKAYNIINIIRCYKRLKTHKRNLKNTLRTQKKTNKEKLRPLKKITNLIFQKYKKRYTNRRSKGIENSWVSKHMYSKNHTLNQHKTMNNFINKQMLLKCGDIETNPRPMPNILKIHPPSHKKRCKTYFIPCTIKLQPEYQHIAKTFFSILKINHLSHINAIRNFPRLAQHLDQIKEHPNPKVLFALITTINPDINACEHQLNRNPNFVWTITLLERMNNLNNPPERHIATLHPYTKFIQDNQSLINPPNTIHKEVYNYIHLTRESLSLQKLNNKFSFLLNNLLKETLNFFEPITYYIHPPPLPIIAPSLQPRIIQNIRNDTQVISWNASSLNTTLPNIQDII